MATKKKVAPMFLLFNRGAVDDAGLFAVLDMLRYDGATVERIGANSVVFRRDDGKKFTVERWASHGLGNWGHHSSDRDYVLDLAREIDQPVNGR